MQIAHKITGKRRKCRLTAVALLSATASTPHHAMAQDIVTPTLASDYRLEIIGFKLATSNPSLCESPAILTGMMLHDESGYSEKLRARAKARYALGSGFGILQVVPDSPAAAVGLKRGDEIIALNGVPMTEFAPNLVRRSASYDRTQQFRDTLDAQLRRGPAILLVERDGTSRELSLSGTPGCGGHNVLIDSNELNAWSDGTNVAVTSRMVEFAGSDDELAFVVAHEMAHNILKHSKKFSLGKLIMAEFGIGSGKVRKAELAADELAVEIMATAGYDLDAPERLLRRAARHSPLNLSLSHPGANRRIAATQNTRGRLAVRQAFWKIQPQSAHEQAGPLATFAFAARSIPVSSPDQITVVARLDRQPSTALFAKQPFTALTVTTAPSWIQHNGLMLMPAWQPISEATFLAPGQTPSWPSLADREIRK